MCCNNTMGANVNEKCALGQQVAKKFQKWSYVLIVCTLALLWLLLLKILRYFNQVEATL